MHNYLREAGRVVKKMAEKEHCAKCGTALEKERACILDALAFCTGCGDSLKSIF